MTEQKGYWAIYACESVYGGLHGICDTMLFYGNEKEAWEENNEMARMLFEEYCTDCCDDEFEADGIVKFITDKDLTNEQVSAIEELLYNDFEGSMKDIQKVLDSTSSLW